MGMVHLSLSMFLSLKQDPPDHNIILHFSKQIESLKPFFVAYPLIGDN